MDSSPPPPPVTTQPNPTPPPRKTKRRKVKYAKAYGYVIDYCIAVPELDENGTPAPPGQFSRTLAAYRKRLAEHCGIEDNSMLTVRNPDPLFSPAICVVVATNLSKRSRVPREDIAAKAREFLGTEDPPKWYYIVRA